MSRLVNLLSANWLIESFLIGSGEMEQQKRFVNSDLIVWDAPVPPTGPGEDRLIQSEHQLCVEWIW